MTPEDIRLNELTVVEQPLLKQVEAMGWTLLEGAEEDLASGKKDYRLLGRDEFGEVFLRDRLRQKIRAINLDANGQPWLTDDLIDAAIAELDRPKAKDFVAINEELHDVLTDGVYLTPEGADRPAHIQLIDLEHWDRNEFIAVSQFRVDGPGARQGKGFIVPDIVLFVNGLPLAVIECKSPATSDPVASAIDQLRRYANRRVPHEQEGAERLFLTNLLCVATSYYEARFGPVTARPEAYLPWRDPAPVKAAEVVIELGKSDGYRLQPQETLVAGMLRPAHLIDILRSFTVFTTTDDGTRVKVVPRYQQFRSVHAALKRLAEGKTRRQHGLEDQRGGVIWHTQGSGKSLTMVFLVRKMRTLPALRRFKVVIMTDRTDLQDQLSETAKLAGQVMRVATSMPKAREHLSRQEPDLVFVMIQKIQDRDDLGGVELRLVEDPQERDGRMQVVRYGKMQARIGESEKFPTLNESEDILVLVDEAHRSHTSTLHQNVLDALPNSARIGFTGTPIEQKGKKLTRTIFGKFIDKYRLQEAEADGAIVKIVYEGRELRSQVADKRSLDDLFGRTFADKTDRERDAIKNRYATKANVLNAEEPFRRKAHDILRHYIDNVLPGGFKAQLVAQSRVLAVDYVEALEAARDAIVGVIEPMKEALLSISEEEAAKATPDVAFIIRALPHLETIKRLQFAAVISAEHNDLPRLKKWSGESETRDRIARFKKTLGEDRLAFLVVKNKLLTGFDAKIEQVMYIDRPMQGAELLQAVGRTNRTAGEEKKFGLVVDYYGVGRSLEEALSIYDAGDLDDIEGGILSPDDLLPELRSAKMAIEKLFADHGATLGADLQAYVDACVGLLADPRLRAEFVGRVKNLLALYDALMPRPEAREFSMAVKLYAFIAKVAYNLYRDTILDLRGVAAKVQSMLDAFIRAHGVDPTIPPIEILDPRFAAQVAEQPTSRARAADMEHALRHHIEAHRETDLAHYAKLSERLEQILAAHREDWRRLADELGKLTDEVRESHAASASGDGLDARTERPVFGIISTNASSTLTEANARDLSRTVAARFRQEAKVAGFWDNAPALAKIRHWLVECLDREDAVPFDQLERVASECVDVARANRKAFGDG